MKIRDALAKTYNVSVQVMAIIACVVFIAGALLF
jgi:hypothetical protein